MFPPHKAFPKLSYKHRLLRRSGAGRVLELVATTQNKSSKSQDISARGGRVGVASTEGKNKLISGRASAENVSLNAFECLYASIQRQCRTSGNIQLRAPLHCRRENPTSQFCRCIFLGHIFGLSTGDHFAHLGGLGSTSNSSPLIIFALFQAISQTDRAAGAAGWWPTIRARVTERTHFSVRVKASVPAANHVSVCLEYG